MGKREIYVSGYMALFGKIRSLRWREHESSKYVGRRMWQASSTVSTSFWWKMKFAMAITLDYI